MATDPDQIPAELSEPATTTTDDLWKAELLRLEQEINEHEKEINDRNHKGIRARWKSGSEMITLRKGGKQLPRGVMAELVRQLGVDRSEVDARMKFAALYSTDEQLSTVIETFGSWSSIKQRGLKTNGQPAGDDAKPADDT